MKPVTLNELTGLIHPHDLPRTEASLIQRTAPMSAAELEAIANGLLLMPEPQESAVRLLFRRWSEVDLAAATTFLTKLPDGPAATAAAAMSARLLGNDAAAARAWAASLADMTWPEERPLEMRPGVPNPFSQVLHRQAGSGSSIKEIAWHTIINSLCRCDPEQAVAAWRQARACGVGCRMLVHRLIAAMAKIPQQALAFIQELDDPAIALDALGSYVQNIAGHSPGEALELIGRMEPGPDRDQVINKVLYAAPSLVGRAQKLYSEEASDYEFISMKQALVALGTREAVRQMVEFPDLIAWKEQAWDTFRDLLEIYGQEKEIRALVSEDLPAAVLSGAASALATTKRTASTQESVELLRRFGPTDDGIVGAVAEYLAEEQGMVAAAEFIASMPKDERGFNWNYACRGGMREDPTATIEWCRDHWSAIPLTHPLRDAIWEWLKSDKSTAIAWSLAHPDPAWRDRLLRIIIEAEAHGHPQRCAEIIAGRIEEEPQASTDPLWIWLAALVCTQWHAARQEEAAAWAGKLPPSPVREAAEAVIRGERHCSDYRLAEEGGP
jgi:hypothetical protein